MKRTQSHGTDADRIATRAMVCAAALWVAGCGSSSTTDEPDEPVSAVERLLDPVETLPPTETDEPDEPVITEEIENGDAAGDGPALTPAEFERRWTALLRRAVHPKTGAVDYHWLATRAGELRALLGSVAADHEPEDERAGLAMQINAYNLWVVVGVIDGKIPDTVREIDGFFDKKKRTLAGKAMTLDELRDRLIRPTGDPRVHAALCYGAVGSAPLATEAYTAAKLDDQLTKASIRFVNNRSRNAVVGGSLLLSPVFKWFGPDFEGEPFNGVAGFVRLYAEPNTPLDFATRAEENPAIEYLEFNWALNGRR